MNKLLTILLFCLIGSFAFAESYQLPTSQGEKELYIPDDAAELREAYIEVASLYIEERFDHEVSLDQVDALLDLSDEYKTHTETLLKGTHDLIRALSVDDTDLFRIYGNIYYAHNFLPQLGHGLGLGVQVQIMESYIVGLFYEIPTSIGLSLSVRFY